MAIERITIRTSNRSGERIPEGKGMTIRLKVNGKRYRADLTSSEVKELVEWLNADEIKPRKKSSTSSRRRRSTTTTRRRNNKPAENKTPVNDESANA